MDILSCRTFFFPKGNTKYKRGKSLDTDKRLVWSILLFIQGTIKEPQCSHRYSLKTPRECWSHLAGFTSLSEIWPGPSLMSHFLPLSFSHSLGSSDCDLHVVLPMHPMLHASIFLSIRLPCLDHPILFTCPISCLTPWISPDSVQTSASSRGLSNPQAGPAVLTLYSLSSRVGIQWQACVKLCVVPSPGDLED